MCLIAIAPLCSLRAHAGIHGDNPSPAPLLCALLDVQGLGALTYIFLTSKHSEGGLAISASVAGVSLSVCPG